MTTEAIEQEILERVRPKPEETARLHAAVEVLSAQVRRAAEELHIEPAPEPLLVGSVAKGTNLTNPDIDLFVLFDPSTTRQELEEQGLALARKVMPAGGMMYAEHPYLRGMAEGFVTEIVPCYRVESAHAKMSAVDRTPFHTRHVMAHLKPEQADQVRLLKQFLKGIGAYGAESTVQGFSGYLVELMVLHGGSFHAVLEQAAKSRRGWRIPDDENAKRFGTPLVVIDPVDSHRNVAAALSEQCFGLFVVAAREYLRQPSHAFFFPNPEKPWPAPQLQQQLAHHGRILGLVAPAPKVVDEIGYPQARKALKNIVAFLERAGFPVLHSAAPFGGTGKDAVLLVELEIPRLAAVRRHEGPPVGVGNEEEFREKWRNDQRRRRGPYLVDGRWVVDIVRETTDGRALLEQALREIDLGPDLGPQIRGHGRVLEGEELVAAAPAALTQFLDPRFPWDR